MNDKEIIELTIELRMAQKEFFKFRLKEDFQKCLTLEKKLDHELGITTLQLNKKKMSNDN